MHEDCTFRNIMTKDSMTVSHYFLNEEKKEQIIIKIIKTMRGPTGSKKE